MQVWVNRYGPPPTEFVESSFADGHRNVKLGTIDDAATPKSPLGILANRNRGRADSDSEHGLAALRDKAKLHAERLQVNFVSRNACETAIGVRIGAPPLRFATRCERAISVAASSNCSKLSTFLCRQEGTSTNSVGGGSVAIYPHVHQ